VALTLKARSGARPKRGLGLVRNCLGWPGCDGQGRGQVNSIALLSGDGEVEAAQSTSGAAGYGRWLGLACSVASLRPITYEVWLWCQQCVSMVNTSGFKLITASAEGDSARL
jgi:hypothetical protein